MVMSYRKTTGVLTLSIAVFGLASCSYVNQNSKNQQAVQQAIADAQARQAALNTYKFSYADGVDICFKKIREKLSEAAMVNEIESIFKVQTTDSAQKSNPALSVYKVQYQDPKNPQQLLSQEMDTNSGEFKQPRPLELTIVGGDPEKFKLETVLIPLKNVDTSTVQAKIDQNKPKLDARLTDYAVYFLDLDQGGMFDDEHKLSLNIAGKFKTNGTKASIGIKFSPDGQKVLSNDLNK
jgi:hypothetical protein